MKVNLVLISSNNASFLWKHYSSCTVEEIRNDTFLIFLLSSARSQSSLCLLPFILKHISLHFQASLSLPSISFVCRASLEEEIDILYKRLSTPVIIHYDGNCEWLSPVTLLSQCKINVRQFPFDEQVIFCCFLDMMNDCYKNVEYSQET